MKKFILTALMLFTVTSYSQVAIAPLGDGSIGTPYQIETIQNLYWINQIWSSWDKYMVLNNDIDASDSQNWDGGTGWTTIGNLSTYFTGNFDGQGHTVSGVYLNRPESDFIGFFGLLSGGTVQNLGITDADISGSQNTGILCGYLDNNAQIVNCYSTGNVSGNSAGGLIGTNSDSSTITGCYSSADVDIRNGGGGGFAGSNNNGIITNCYSTGEVSDTSYNNASGLGGFIGGNANNSLINYCYSTGNVIEDSYIHLEGESAGGFASVNSTSAISNCYSKGDVIAENSTYTGGFIARNNNSSTISYCYSTGNVTVSILSGGFIGDSYTSTANYCLWDTDTSGMLTSAGGTGKTTLEMNTESTYTDAGWDFINNWDINTVTNSSYPYFQWQTVPTDPVVYTEAPAQIGSNSAVIQCDLSNLGTPVPFQHGICWNQTGNPSLSDSKTEEGIPTQAGLYNSEMTGLQSNTQYFVKAYATNTNGTFYGEEISFTSILIASTPPSSGDGSSGNPYIISSMENLQWLSLNFNEWDKHYVQTANINAALTSQLNNGDGWHQIGDNSPDNGYKVFSGSYDGQGYIISNLSMNRITTDYAGFFGRAENADIRNLGLVNVNITGGSFVGGLTGTNMTTPVTNCFVTGNVSGESFVGGISGSSSGNITNCHTSGNVNAVYWSAGGLAGKNYEVISNSYSECNVTGTVDTYYIGGLVGESYDSGSYSDARILNCYSTGNVSNGMYVGGLVGRNNSYALVFNSYSTGTVSGDSYVGGLVGQNISSTVTNSFWDTDTSGQALSDGGTGKTTAEMKSLLTFTDAGWDFVNETVNGTEDIWSLGGFTNSGYPWLTSQEYGSVQLEGLSISVSGTNASLVWEELSGATSYNVYSSEDPNAEFPGEEWTLVAENITDTSWVDSAAAGSKKFYLVVGVN